MTKMDVASIALFVAIHFIWLALAEASPKCKSVYWHGFFSIILIQVAVTVALT